MTGRTRRAVPRLGALALTLALAAGSTVTTIAPAGAASGPSGLRATEVSAKAIALTWSKLGEDAYRVRFSASPSMSTPETWDVIGNYSEWSRTDGNPTVSAARLNPGATYYFQVKAIKKAAASSGRTDLSGYSSPVAVTTSESGDYPELAPVQAKATSGGADTLYVSWRTRGPGVAYELQYRKSSASAWSSKVFDAAGGAIEGLTASTTYQLRVRVVEKGSAKALSDFSDTWSAATKTASSAGISVVSYNVRKPTGSPGWGDRRALVAASIKAQSPDVVALQEATPVSVSVDGKKVRQYTDVLNLLGSKYDYVSSANTSGSRLAYDTTRLSLVKAGTKILAKLGSSRRYAVWAILKDKLTDKSVFVINTHLEPGSNKSSKHNNVRIKQAKQVLALISANSGGRPVVVTGDMNSSRSAKPNNGPYIKYMNAGLIDPLDNASGSWISGEHAIAENRVDAEYNSYNAYASTARRTPFPIGTNVDYILVSKGVRVSLWRTVVNVNTAGQFVGTIPSDHNLVTATVHLP
jgi:endonuclease/exonuclease/phosphatase family metal-dependent hydrolase